MMPVTKPKLGRGEVERRIRAAGVREAVALLGLRGYYRRTMGDPARNDFGLYDDAFFLLTPTACWSWNGNTDPSRAGWNSQVGKGMAVLAPGVWLYRQGLHKGRPALVQADAVVVLRGADPATGAAGVPDRGWFGINIHAGGVSTTSSEGCQTVPPSQWPTFLHTVTREMAAAGQSVLPYVLEEA